MTDAITSTSERILHEAFLLFTSPRFTGISLSEIAKNVGISKPAIFRHFPNKDALIDTMNTRFHEVIRDFCKQLPNDGQQPDIKTIHGQQLFKDGIKQTVLFFADKPEFVGYFLFSFVSQPNFENDLVTYLGEQGVTFFGTPYSKIDEQTVSLASIPQYLKLLFTMCTIIVVLLRYYSGFADFPTKKQANPSVSTCLTVENLADITSSFITNGNEQMECLSNEQIAYLDELCIINESELPPENKVFSALSAVICRYGFPGVTVERIADEMGLAKSSLYSYFDNKDELIRKMIIKEMTAFANILATRTHSQKSLSESTYIHLKTLINYLTTRPQIVPVFGWLRLRNGCFAEDIQNIAQSSNLKNSNYQSKVNIQIAQWISTLPVSLFIQGLHYSFTQEQLSQSIIQLHRYICGGIFIDA